MDHQLRRDRLSARVGQDSVNEQRRIQHLPVARALRDPSHAASIIALAKVKVLLWRDRGLCRGDYIAAWDELMQQPARAAAILEEQSVRAIALRQDSPFVSSVRQFNALINAAQRNPSTLTFFLLAIRPTCRKLARHSARIRGMYRAT